MNCLVGCIEKASKCGKPQEPVNGETQSPIVTVTWKRRDSSITVGNESDPDNENNAVIKSFEYGASDGLTINLEILDMQGGEFQKFVDRVSKDKDESLDDSITQIQFGWVIGQCDGTVKKKLSQSIFAIVMGIEAAFAEGKVKFKVTLQTQMNFAFSNRQRDKAGESDKPVHIKTAIRKLMSERTPKMEAQFLRRERSGKLTPFEFKGQVVANFSADNQNKLSAASKWYEPFLTDRGKGIIPMWIAVEEKPTILFMEDPTPGKGENVPPGCEANLATFIVNAGSCGNVISFTPTINWSGNISSKGQGGATGGIGTGKTSLRGDKNDTGGVTQSAAVSGPALTVHGNRAAEETIKGQIAHAKASRLNSPNLMAIKAELKIQGNPDVVDLVQMKGKFVSIIVINPFTLTSIDDAGTGGCGDWLAKPMCNEFLTDQHWQIIGVGHSIREGSYVTTLQVVLNPGQDKPETVEDFGVGSGVNVGR